MLETARLRLRAPTVDDFERIHALTDSDAMRVYLGREPPTREDSFARLLRSAGCFHLFGWGTFMVESKADGAFVGSCGLFRAMRGLGPDFDPYPEAGWVIAQAFWGQGHASEAMAAILDWYDQVHGDQPVVAIISPGNLPSERVADKLGFRPIGLATYKGDEIMRYSRGG